ncbi:hypothetical protein AMTRI_Chr03g56000 [Amborella trichopoda]
MAQKLILFIAIAIAIVITFFPAISVATDYIVGDEMGSILTQLPWLPPGNKWYICSSGYHCESGQKLKITVYDSMAPIPTPAPAPIPWPMPEPAPAPWC